MPFIPNYTDATFPDQAEPDSGDFEILLAGTHGDGVLSGCAVTANVSPFSPLDIAGLHAWWDFSDAATLFTDTGRTVPVASDGDSIKGVTDKSGVGKHLSEGTNPPQYKVSIQNSLSVARFDGTNDVLANTALTLSATQTIFFVLKKRTAPSGNHGALFDALANYQIWTKSTSSATDWMIYNSDTSPGEVVFTGATANAWGVLTYAYASTASLVIYYNGTQVASFNPLDTDTTTTTFQLGGDGGGASMDVDWGELILYTGAALSTTDRESVEAYLQVKWNTP